MFRLLYKSSYVLRSVLVDWMYQKMRNVCIENFFNVQCNNTLFVFVFVMPNQKLDFVFFESFIYNKNGFFSVLQVLIPTVLVVFSMKAIAKN